MASDINYSLSSGAYACIYKSFPVKKMIETLNIKKHEKLKTMFKTLVKQSRNAL